MILNQALQLVRGDKMIFESHAHYDDVQFDSDRKELLTELKGTNIGIIINPASDLDSAAAIIKLCNEYDYFYGAVGIHPTNVASMHDQDLETILCLGAHQKTVAIGEVGLDYYYDRVPREIQRLWFREQIKLALELELPLIVHSRDAAKDTYDILEEMGASQVGGVIHCFSSSLEMARRFVALGFYIGIGGVVTFDQSKEIKEVVKGIDLEHLLIETDAPYLAPTPNRGKRNDSRNLTYIIEAIAEIKGIDEKTVEEVTYMNGMNLFLAK